MTHMMKKRTTRRISTVTMLTRAFLFAIVLLSGCARVPCDRIEAPAGAEKSADAALIEQQVREYLSSGGYYVCTRAVVQNCELRIRGYYPQPVEADWTEESIPLADIDRATVEVSEEMGRIWFRMKPPAAVVRTHHMKNNTETRERSPKYELLLKPGGNITALGEALSRQAGRCQSR